MLISLHVKDLALIEETEVFFGSGLNILTGETGAGKSIIIGSINLALGAKAEKELIRNGKEYALIELLFELSKEEQERFPSEFELPIEEDGTLLIARKILPTKSICKVNGETVTAKQLKLLAAFLLDMYGQHEHQSLLDKKKHAMLLDEYCGAKLFPVMERLADEFKIYTGLKKELTEAKAGEQFKDKDFALAEFEVKEIEEAGLLSGEDTKLEMAYRKMSYARKIAEAVSECSQYTGAKGDDGAAELVGRALRELGAVASYDEEIENLVALLGDVEGLLSDFNHELNHYLEGLSFEEAEFQMMEAKLNLYHHMKSKYGNTVEDIFHYRDLQKEKLDKFSHYEEYLELLEEKCDAAKSKLLKSAAQASKIRREGASSLKEKMITVLHDLNFQEVEFEVSLVEEPEAVTAKGYDKIEFLISTNPGEPVKPLENVASGGELSRIMLGIKTIMAGKDEIHTLIFDEIDVGISGKTAWQVARRLGELGREHQVICITHLAQIASMADIHFKIEKKVENEKTRTEIFKLNENQSVEELARLLGGDTLTDAALLNAKEMKELAANTKLY